MTRGDFLAALRRELQGLPPLDIERSVEYYNEMIADRMEDGLTEDQAVADIGEVGAIAAQIRADVSPDTPAPAPKPAHVWRAWEIVLLVLGSPIWLSLLITAAALLFAVYAVLWSLVISLYAVVFSLAVAGVAGICGVFAYALTGNVAAEVFMVGFGFFCAGLSIFLLLGTNAAARGCVWLSKQLWRGVRRVFGREGEAQ